ncbi:MAG: lipoyl(octanoyl) transferase LipB [Gemmatimonadota bacterium]|nr:lipoyl(octanoyl) transferase LipB [Gemmatimonadota bacterium]
MAASREAATPPAVGRVLEVVDLGRRGYREVLALQRARAARRRAEPETPDALLFVEHEPVITLGRGSERSHVVASDAWLAERGVEVVEIERGGDVTYHGPGQLVGYPILDLRGYRQDLHWYLRRLEETILRTLAALGLPGFRLEAYTGVWTGDAPPGSLVERGSDGFGTLPAAEAGPLVAAGTVRKVASIGVHASRWITRHGFALNVTDEPLDHFAWIVPCGIDGVSMTSIEREGAPVALPRVRDLLLRGFNAAFPQARPRRVPESALDS